MSALTYIIFILVAVAACILGAVGAYFYFQARNRETKAVLEALDQDISEREEKLRRLKLQVASAQPAGSAEYAAEAEAEIERLQHALKQKQSEYDLLKHDFDLEIDLLKQEVEEIRRKRSDSSQTPPTAPKEIDQHLRKREQELRERGETLRKHAEAVRAQAEALRAREASLSEREQAVAERMKEIEAEIATRDKEIDDSLADRQKQLQEGLESLEEERKILASKREALAEKEARIDAELMDLPTERFTRDQEAILIKRLREQNKIQRGELEKLHRELDRAKRELASRNSVADPERAVEAVADFRVNKIVSEAADVQKQASGDGAAGLGSKERKVTVPESGMQVDEHQSE